MNPAEGGDRPLRFGVVGSPIAHSLSPVLHSAAYRELGVTGVRYTAHEVPAGGLARFLEQGEGTQLAGVSVTMPLKQEAHDLGAGGQRDAVSTRLGISNTLVRRADGAWRAENFDVPGIISSLADHGATRIRRGGVVGSGATALSAVEALLQLGAREILLTARSAEKLDGAVRRAEQGGAAVRLVPWERSEMVCEADAAVSALAADGAGDLAARWSDLGPRLPRPDVFLDVIYDPWPAPLAAVMSAHGVEVASGLEMLVHQAGGQLISMLGEHGIALTPEQIPLRAMGEAARAALQGDAQSAEDPAPANPS